jgi:hypothetical protein
MSSSQNPLGLAHARKGSALILVLIMTLSLAGLAMSAIYLSSSAGLLSRYYDRERNYRYAAEAAIALGKSRVQVGDTSLHLPDDTAKLILNGASLTDAAGVTIPRVQVNLYGGYTGDTVGIFGQFATFLAQAYDSGGTRMVRRLDLVAESFSRFAMFTNTYPGGLCYGTGEFLNGRAHSNQIWNSCGPPGPTYFDTVSAHTTITGQATYLRDSIPNAPIIPMPTIAKLAALTTYAANANLQFTPVTATSASGAPTQPRGSGGGSGSVNLSGKVTAGNPTRGTRVRFKPVDMDSSGTLEVGEGMMMIFDVADGIDTAAIRVDIAATPTTAADTNNITLMNQCGLLVHFATGQVVNPGPTFTTAHNEFFPLARFREPWVLHRIRAGTTPVGATAFTAADSTAFQGTTAGWGNDSLQNKAVYAKVLGYGVGNSRCFPVGSPQLMLAERNVDATCTVSTATNVIVFGWGSGVGGAGCAATKQYGGMDSTFTASPMRCAYLGKGTIGRCTQANGTGFQISLGAWRLWGGAALPTIAAGVLQAVEKPYLWPLWIPYNLNSKGVVNATTGPVYLSDTLRGYVTFYESNATKDVNIIAPLVYDQIPNASTALCRNFLGIIAGQNVLASNEALQRPRVLPGNAAVKWLGTPNLSLHAVTMALNGTVGIEDGYNYPTTSPGGPTSPTAICNAFTQSGGCINQIGGVIEQFISPTYVSANDGYRENRTVDPCQKTNQRPPFFPATGRYLDNKYYEIDPTLVDTWPKVKLFFESLRGHTH